MSHLPNEENSTLTDKAVRDVLAIMNEVNFLPFSDYQKMSVLRSSIKVVLLSLVQEVRREERIRLEGHGMLPLSVHTFENQEFRAECLACEQGVGHLVHDDQLRDR